MRYCEHCGGRVPPDSKFCPLCGKRLAPLPPQGEPPAAGDPFCGAPLPMNGMPPNGAPAPLPPAAGFAPPPNIPPYGAPSPMNGMPPCGAPAHLPPYAMQPLPRAYFVQPMQMPCKRVGSFSIVGFTLSCFSMLLFYFGLLGLLFAGAGIVLSAVGIGKRRSMSLWGLGLAGVLVGCFFLLMSFIPFCVYLSYGPFGILSLPYMAV